MKTTIECPNCDCVSEFCGASQDEIGWHVLCPECDGSFDIDIEDYVLPIGTIVTVTGIDFETYEAPWVGIIDGDDADDCYEFAKINYYVVPLDRAKGDAWGNGTFMMSEFFDVCDEQEAV